MLRKIFVAALLIFPLLLLSQPSFHYFSMKTIDGSRLDFSTFYGKKLMVVNTASYCGYTYQYEALENLYTEYNDSNFAIIGFPCNDFGGQEPESDSSIYEFCQEIYGIDFQMMSKVSITAPDTADVYKWLTRAALNGVSNATITWNFHKFLIDEAGHWVAHYSQHTEPNDPAIIAWLQSPSVLPPDTTDTTATAIVIPEFTFGISGISTGIIQVSFSNHAAAIAAKIYSAAGQLHSTMYVGHIKPSETIYANTKSLDSGIYLLRVTNGIENRSFRFVVMK